MWHSLNGNDWQLLGYLPSSHRFNAESGIDFAVAPLIDAIPATVPGSVHADLWRAGLIRNPFVDDGSLTCEWVENKGWLYRRTVTLTQAQCCGNIDLVCKGVVYEARFYCNGVLLGTHKNMFTPAVFSLNAAAHPGENLLEIHCEPAPYNISQMGNTTDVVEMLARYFYSWDFSPRMVGLGLWKDVGLCLYKQAKLGECAIETDVDESGAGVVRARCGVQGRTENARVAFTLSFNGKTICEQTQPADNGLCRADFSVVNPALWWPAGHGEQPLYTLTATLLSSESEEESQSYRLGIRSLRYEQNEHSPADALPYTVVINGKKIWLKGTNLLPLSHMPGSVTPQDYREAVEGMLSQNVNLVRIWGGGYPERDVFYDLCDEAGLMVWQEMPQSNSGIDGIPSKHPEFLRAFADACDYTAAHLARHTCIVIWDGGNELKDKNRNPASLADENLAMVQKIIAAHDNRIFHPSCPSGPRFNFADDAESIRLQRSHNIHGEWAYLGKEQHYAFYNRFEHLYHGEFGVGGAADFYSLAEMMSQQHLEAFAQNDPVWLARGNGWWNSLAREKDIFGEEVLSSVATFSMASQLMQAEGLRYLLEMNRRRAFMTSGCNIWQYNEPYPNANCSNTVCYSGRPKMAHYAARTSYAPLCASMKYTRLYYFPGEAVQGEVYLHASHDFSEADVLAQMLNEDGAILHEEMHRCKAARESTRVCAFSPCVPQMEGVFFVRVRVLLDGETAGENLYCFGTSEQTPLRSLLHEQGGQLTVQCVREGGTKIITMRNTGIRVVPYIALLCREDAKMRFSENYITLMPGESRAVRCEGRADAQITVRDLAGKLEQYI